MTSSTGAGLPCLYTLKERFDVEVADADAVHGRDDAAQDMVETVVLLGVLDGHDVLYVLHHADDALHTFGVGADGAEVGVADTMADAAVVDIRGEAVDGIGHVHHLLRRLLEQVQCKAKGRPFAHAWERGEDFHGFAESG